MTTETVVKKKETILCKLHYKKISAPINLTALSEVFSLQRYSSILGGNDSKSNSDRFSCWMAEPREIFEFRAGQKDPFTKLQKTLDKYKLEDGFENKLPKGIFCGGWAGYFGYELGRYIEKLPATTTDDLRMPLIHLCFYDKVIVYDHIEKTLWILILQLPDDTETVQEKIGWMEKLLKRKHRNYQICASYLASPKKNTRRSNVK